MGSLGSYVREAREARGLDLREAAQQTRISVGYLKAIEDEDFAKLPGQVFVKGFLKSYAKFLRLPEDEIMKRFAEVTGGTQQPAAVSGTTPVPKAPKAEPRKAAAAPAAGSSEEEPARIGLEPFLWGGAVIIGLAVFILTAIPQKRPTGEHAPIIATQGTDTAGVHSAPAATVKPEKLFLNITALEDVWVLVRTDASPQKKAVLKKGETVTWSADERFLLSYASIGAARLELNGRELTVNGPKNAVVRDLIVSATGIALQKMEAEKPKPRKPKPVSQSTATATPQSPAQPVAPAPQTVTPVPSPAPASQPAPEPAPIFPPPREQ
jgi:cytoskeletal protein RodZ